MRWKALKWWGCFDDPITGARPTKKETYGFKTEKTPKLPTEGEYPHIDWEKVKNEVEILREFEDELFKIPKKVKFRFFDNPLQRTMRADLKTVKSSCRVVVKADKTRNFYGVPPQYYHYVMVSNINNDYAEVDQRELDEVNYDAADLAEGLGIAERAEVFQKKSAFVTFKRH